MHLTKLKFKTSPPIFNFPFNLCQRWSLTFVLDTLEDIDYICSMYFFCCLSNFWLHIFLDHGSVYINIEFHETACRTQLNATAGITGVLKQ